jgi:O-antigen/teichoic acid export membrane protein
MVALMAPGLVTLFRDWGVNSAMIKYMAQYRSENKASEVKSLLVAGLSFELISGFFLSLILFFLAGFIAANIFNRPEITPLIQVASFTVFAGALLTASQSFFTGYEKMELTSITMVCQSVLKTVLAPLLIVLGLGAFGAILGSTISSLKRAVA